MNVIKWDEDGQMTNSEVDSSARELRVVTFCALKDSSAHGLLFPRDAVERRQESGDQIKQEIKQEQDDLISGQVTDTLEETCTLPV